MIMKANLENIIDISVELSGDTVIYPGDPKPQYELFESLKNGGIANVGGMKHGLHHGTHVDVPYHFKNGAKTIEQVSLEHWVGSVLVVDATAENRCITADTLKDVPLGKYKRILFKTKNSTDYYRRPEFYEKFIYLDEKCMQAIGKE